MSKVKVKPWKTWSKIESQKRYEIEEKSIEVSIDKKISTSGDL